MSDGNIAGAGKPIDGTPEASDTNKPQGRGPTRSLRNHTWSAETTPESDPEFVTAFRAPRAPPPTDLPPLTAVERDMLRALAASMKKSMP